MYICILQVITTYTKVVHGQRVIKSVNGWMKVKWAGGKYQGGKLQVIARYINI